MKTLSSTLVAISSLASLVQAVPKVTPVLDDRGCAAYPLYGPGTGFVAHFSIEVNQCTDPETSEPCSIEGYGPNFEGRRIDGEEHFTQGYITIVAIKDQAKTRIQCGMVEDVVEALTYDPAGGETDYSYNSINVADDPASANLMWGLPEDETTPIEPYHHFIDGEEQEGTFLGSQNVTTWGIKEYTKEDGPAYWLFRLLVPGSEDPDTGRPLKEGEYETFIKVADYI